MPPLHGTAAIIRGRQSDDRTGKSGKTGIQKRMESKEPRQSSGGTAALLGTQGATGGRCRCRCRSADRRTHNTGGITEIDMVHELLGHGRDKARTGRHLATILNCDIRQITGQIEKERREGHPICAAMGENPGYYLAADDKELQDYCERLKGRAVELFKTRQALVKVLKEISQAQEA